MVLHVSEKAIAFFNNCSDGIYSIFVARFSLEIARDNNRPINGRRTLLPTFETQIAMTLLPREIPTTPARELCVSG